MKFAIIIPAYNEEHFIGKTLDSLLAQTLLPNRIVVVDDNSTDRTAEIVRSYDSEIITLVNNRSENKSMPGAKIVRAFNKGLEHIDLECFDIICKYDADLIFPENYLEVIGSRFRESEKIGMVAGHCIILKNDSWVRESLTNKDHIRGPLKAYKKACFIEMDGLKESIGWDTADEMIARFQGWKTVTINNLFVKHLKPTGSVYNSYALQLQGKAFHRLRYGVFLTLITSIKLALKKKSLKTFFSIWEGFFSAVYFKEDYILNEEQGRFMKSYRYNMIKNKIRSFNHQ